MHWLSLVVLLATPLSSVMIQAALFRTPLKIRFPRQVIALLACLAILPVNFLALFAIENKEFWTSLSPVLFSLIVTVALAHVSFHIFNMGETARRIRILINLWKKEASPSRDYTPQDMIEVRLQRLCDMRQIELREDRYHPKITILSLTARLMKLYERLIFPASHD